MENEITSWCSRSCVSSIVNKRCSYCAFCEFCELLSPFNKCVFAISTFLFILCSLKVASLSHVPNDGCADKREGGRCQGSCSPRRRAGENSSPLSTLSVSSRNAWRAQEGSLGRCFDLVPVSARLNALCATRSPTLSSRRRI
jgi:hypothetical protein